MIRPIALTCLLLLAACQEEPPPGPVVLTEDAVGHFCQMNMIEHPGPKAQVHLDGLPGAPLFFSQVRDAVLFQRMPERDNRIVAIYVNDMGAAASWEDPGVANWIDAHKAVYVTGSRRMGAMEAPEFVPFGSADQARAFADEFGGKVMTLDEIPDELVMPVAGPDSDADYAGRLSALAGPKED